MTERVVGLLVNGDTVYCSACVPSYTRAVPLYHSNVYPYNQDCAKCHTCLVLGNPHFCILFDGAHNELEY